MAWLNYTLPLGCSCYTIYLFNLITSKTVTLLYFICYYHFYQGCFDIPQRNCTLCSLAVNYSTGNVHAATALTNLCFLYHCITFASCVLCVLYIYVLPGPLYIRNMTWNLWRTKTKPPCSWLASVGLYCWWRMFTRLNTLLQFLLLTSHVFLVFIFPLITVSWQKHDTYLFILFATTWLLTLYNTRIDIVVRIMSLYSFCFTYLVPLIRVTLRLFGRYFLD